MITGFNTDIEHDGVVYHVQSEDKGLDSPLILSLVYIGGTILASKRSPYHDLIASGFDEKVLVKRLERQHMLICAAIQAGRIEDLKRMGKEAKQASESDLEEVEADIAKLVDIVSPIFLTEAVKQPTAPIIAKTAVKIPEVEPAHPAEPRKPDPPPPAATEPEGLQLAWIDEKQLRAGEIVTLKIKVSRNAGAVESLVPDASVTVKVLGSAFRPLVSAVRTDQKGIAIVSAALPPFTTGRAAILIRAESGGDGVEMRRIIQRA